MKYLSLLFVSFLLLAACTKKKTVQNVNTNNSKDSLTYQPKVPGSKWTYQRSLNGVLHSTYASTRLSYDTTFNGQTYQVFDAETQGYQYIRQDGDKYYLVLTAAANKTELMVIDASKNVNDTWVGGVNGTDTYYYTLKEKYPTYTLDGFTFKNVLKIYQEKKDQNNNVSLAGDTYYAQGVGQILSQGTIAGIGVEIKLISVDLK
nr:hypothetical protein [Chitinophagaceae bacterium]